MTFTKQIERFGQKAMRRVDGTVRNFVFAITEASQQLSPVYSGRYRASWRVAVGTVDSSFEGFRPKRISPPVAGIGTTDPAVSARFRAEISALNPRSKIFISQSVPYVPDIEGGYSVTKAPEGVAAPLSLAVETLFGRLNTFVPRGAA